MRLGRRLLRRGLIGSGRLLRKAFVHFGEALELDAVSCEGALQKQGRREARTLWRGRECLRVSYPVSC